MDISKAFDTVPHAAIRPALKRLGVPGIIADYIQNMYKDCSTTVSGSNGEATINLKRGVKQGCPLSPFLFNAMMNPVLKFISNAGNGVEMDGEQVSVMAFAEDTVLFSRDAGSAASDLKILHTFLKGMGLRLELQRRTGHGR